MVQGRGVPSIGQCGYEEGCQNPVKVTIRLQKRRHMSSRDCFLTLVALAIVSPLLLVPKHVLWPRAL